jgi:hypothetical protein
MPSKPKLSPHHKALVRRYLVWAYKSTKESFDRLERKTTQLLADEFILGRLPRKGSEGYLKLVDGYKEYIAKKKENPIDPAQHEYLKNRLDAVEEAIRKFLGAKELARIEAAYEEEFTRRIWEARDH